MRDQYQSLKAIDTSSSSPELKEPAKQRAALERPRRHQLHATTTTTAAAAANLATSSSSSSSGAGREQPAGFIRNKLQNLIRPRRFQLSSSGESKSSSCRQQATGGRFACREGRDEETNGSPELSDRQSDDQTPLDNLECPQRRLFGSDELVRRRPVLLAAQLQQVPSTHQTRKRPQRAQVMMPSTGGGGGGGGGLPARAHLSESKHQQQMALVAQGQTTSKTSAGMPQANYTTKSDNLASSSRLELAKCYDEIDQIYDYIRGLAPLPAELRKIKAIDFEQIEREHQRHKANQQLQKQQLHQQQQQRQQQQIHHIHRQRFVKSISMAHNEPTAGSGSGESTTNESGTMRKPTRVRQRVRPELIGSDSKQRASSPKQGHAGRSQNEQAGARPSKLRETLRFLVPLPIRVTARASESQKPSIKRVESLNLGALHKLEPKPVANLEAKLAQQRKIRRNEVVELNSAKFPNYNLLRTTAPGQTQAGGQLFRLPRAHSTSTLSKPMGGQTNPRRLGPQHQQGPARAPPPSSQRGLGAAIREESPPVVRLKGIAYEHAINSLQRNASGSKKRPSFESELVESYVDEDENEVADGVEQQARSRSKANSSTSLKSRPLLRPVLTSSCNEADNETESKTSSSGSSSSSSSSASSSSSSSPSSSSSSSSSASCDKWSYKEEPSKNQRSADGCKSHSDYDHESASGSSAETIGDSATSSSSSGSEADSEPVGEDEGVRAQFRSDAPPSRRASSTSKRSHRPTTSSSPSSGRPASPVDMTNESDDQFESNLGDRLVDSSSSSSSSSSSEKPAADPSSNYKQPVHRHEEHIYEQIPAHRGRAQATRQSTSGHEQAIERHQQALKSTSKQSQARVSSQLANRKGAPGAFAPARAQQSTTGTAINHPVAYAANVATNRRYQQQVAALFALQQQQRNRHQQSATNPRHKLANVPLTSKTASAAAAASSYHLGHQRRASASNVQLATPNLAALSSGPASLNVGSLKWKHRQSTNELLDVPLRQRLSMSNIHLLSGLPLATLRSPRSKPHQQPDQLASSKTKRLTEQRLASKKELSRRSLDDHDAESTTGTTNSTSSYEAAIKNSEPDPLRVDMISPPSDGEQLRPASSKRSVGSGSGSRSLTNHSHQQVLQPNSGANIQQQQQQQTSLLVKVPKLSKQSHLLKRPLPKPPASLNRSYAGAGNYLRQPQKVSNRPE